MDSEPEEGEILDAEQLNGNLSEISHSTLDEVEVQIKQPPKKRPRPKKRFAHQRFLSQSRRSGRNRTSLSSSRRNRFSEDDLGATLPSCSPVNPPSFSPPRQYKFSNDHRAQRTISLERSHRRSRSHDSNSNKRRRRSQNDELRNEETRKSKRARRMNPSNQTRRLFEGRNNENEPDRNHNIMNVCEKDIIQNIDISSSPKNRDELVSVSSFEDLSEVAEIVPPIENSEAALFDEDEVAIVAEVDTRLNAAMNAELIVLDSTSSSESEYEKDVKTDSAHSSWEHIADSELDQQIEDEEFEMTKIQKVISEETDPTFFVPTFESIDDEPFKDPMEQLKPEVDDDLETLELRRMALEGLIMQVVEPNAQRNEDIEVDITNPESISTIGHTELISICSSSATSIELNNIDDSTEYSHTIINNVTPISSVLPGNSSLNPNQENEDNEKENELEIYLLRQKLLSDMKKKKIKETDENNVDVATKENISVIEKHTTTSSEEVSNSNLSDQIHSSSKSLVVSQHRKTRCSIDKSASSSSAQSKSSSAIDSVNQSNYLATTEEFNKAGTKNRSRTNKQDLLNDQSAGTSNNESVSTRMDKKSISKHSNQYNLQSKNQRRRSKDSYKKTPTSLKRSLTKETFGSEITQKFSHAPSPWGLIDTTVASREHERPTSYAYSPLPIQTNMSTLSSTQISVPLSVTTFSVSISSDNSLRTVIPHEAVSGSSLSIHKPRPHIELPSTFSYEPLPPPPAQISPGLHTETQRPNSYERSIIASNNYLTDDDLRLKISKPGHQSQIEKIAEPFIKRSVAILNSPVSLNPTLNPYASTYKTSRQNDIYSIKRTVINPQAHTLYRSAHKSDHRHSNLRSTSTRSKPHERIVIPLNQDDSTDEEDLDRNSASERDRSKSPAASKDKVVLPEGFHSRLDMFLKRARESASLKQAEEKVNQVIPTEKETFTDYCIPISSVENLTKPFEQDKVEYKESSNQSTVINLNEFPQKDKNLTVEIPKCSPIFPMSQEKSYDDLISPVAYSSSVESPAILISNLESPSPSLSESNGGEESLVENLISIGKVYKADTVHIEPCTDGQNEMILQISDQVEIPNNISLNALNNFTPIEKTKKNDPQQLATSTTISLKKQANQTRQELQLRERLLRATLQRNEERLKLSSKENDLVKMRENVSELMGQALQKMTKHSERNSQCGVLERKVDELRKQLEKAEMTLLRGRDETTKMQMDVFKTIDKAFNLRTKAAKFGTACRSLGLQIVGEKYQLPTNGAKELTTKIKNIYSKSMNGKDLKGGMKEAQNEIYLVWKPPSLAMTSSEIMKTDSKANRTVENVTLETTGAVPISVDEDMQGETLTRYASSQNPVDDGNPVNELPISDCYRVVGIVLGLGLTQPNRDPLDRYNLYQSPLDCLKRNLRNGWDSRSVVCKDDLNETCKKPQCKFQHIKVLEPSKKGASK